MFPPNEAQREIIEHIDGPLRVIAGPGTGKTATIVLRVAHMVMDKGIDPGSIMVATFTKKAANELTSRIANEFAERQMTVDTSRMLVGTFHSICLRLASGKTMMPCTSSAAKSMRGSWQALSGRASSPPRAVVRKREAG